jgi:hypothetical protein
VVEYGDQVQGVLVDSPRAGDFARTGSAAQVYRKQVRPSGSVAGQCRTASSPPVTGTRYSW